MTHDQDPDKGIRCPLEPLLKVLSRQWVAHMLWSMGRQGPLGFAQMRRQWPDLSAKVLREQLRILEEEGLVFRRQLSAKPLRVVYGLTERGRALDRVLMDGQHLLPGQNWVGSGRRKLG
ncbi:MAG: winged helix-turn-helix transcriptional regulator [Candidatus Competibacterales bacterium]